MKISSGLLSLAVLVLPLRAVPVDLLLLHANIYTGDIAREDEHVARAVLDAEAAALAAIVEDDDVAARTRHALSVERNTPVALTLDHGSPRPR